jgi:Holliday junction DNA helicase RuvB
VRDFADIRANGRICKSVASDALDMLEVDHAGLDGLDRRLLQMVVRNFQGGPVGIESLAAALSEQRDTLEDVVEPYLIQQGYLVRTSRGRVASDLAWQHLGIENPQGDKTTG